MWHVLTCIHIMEPLLMPVFIQIRSKAASIWREHNVSQRWAIDSAEYYQAKQELFAKKKSLLLTKLSSCARDRWFLLTVKRKFSGQKVKCINIYFSDQVDGQYMASRISKQITKQTGQLIKLMVAYNELAATCNCDAISWDEFTNLESSFWLRADQQEPLKDLSDDRQLLYCQHTTVLWKSCDCLSKRWLMLYYFT